jgi:hypothetical protein
MTAIKLRRGVMIAAMLAAGTTPALAQQGMPNPEQRIERLENQLRQVQRQVFPRGQPADTAGVALEPAATQSSVRTLDARITGWSASLPISFARPRKTAIACRSCRPKPRGPAASRTSA